MPSFKRGTKAGKVAYPGKSFGSAPRKRGRSRGRGRKVRATKRGY